MDKVESLETAVKLVDDGDDVALTGFAITRNAIAAAHALIRAGVRDLSVSQVIGGMETDLLAAAGCITRLTYSGGSLDRFGSLQGINRAHAEGHLELIEYSSLALTLRFHAGALGLPFVPARSMLGSDLLAPLQAAGEVQVGTDPFGGEPVVLLPPLRPDIAFVHADVADHAGNAVVKGPTWAIRETALAARTVVVICEELVTNGEIDPNSVLIPAAVVAAVCLVPFGAHPTALAGRYDYDRGHLEEYSAANRTSRDAHAAYLDRYVYGLESHDDYLTLVGLG